MFLSIFELQPRRFSWGDYSSYYFLFRDPHMLRSWFIMNTKDMLSFYFFKEKQGRKTKGFFPTFMDDIPNKLFDIK